MEGWYYRLTLTDEGVSFAFILSIEDPGISSSNLNLACIQVVGPDDGYLVQADADDTKFWAARHQQALGCTFEYKDTSNNTNGNHSTELSIAEWKNAVKSGFQILPDHLLGRVEGHDGRGGGVLPGQGTPGYCEFDISIEPICGWGGTGSSRQKSTAGWLASFDIFEPHWQVTLADARASGRVVWQNQTFEFQDQPFYAEKNWGKSLPMKWFWTQCNSFDGYDQLSVTAGGGIRQIPLGQKEALGMVSVHYNGAFYEAVPWTGDMRWNVSTWGYWLLSGRCTSGEKTFEVEIIYECDPEKIPGLVFRAPTPDEGMVYFCKDTFEAKTTLTLWELEKDEVTGKFMRNAGPPLIDRATSSQGGAEIGGGPWWDSWVGESKVKKPIQKLLQIRYNFRKIRNRIRS